VREVRRGGTEKVTGGEIMKRLYSIFEALLLRLGIDVEAWARREVQRKQEKAARIAMRDLQKGGTDH